ncbi:hypothetical protein C5167_015254 [Papaver somniferum]|uniref:Uncharacterized protein n=1 Tax=Papaver somniferum TaxID=3469 RepID=A0A4Y7J9V1_PAPSO|nr:hypothetical protein C5167_015254 [Papaver somniferum]
MWGLRAEFEYVRITALDMNPLPSLMLQCGGCCTIKNLMKMDKLYSTSSVRVLIDGHMAGIKLGDEIFVIKSSASILRAKGNSKLPLNIV